MKSLRTFCAGMSTMLSTIKTKNETRKGVGGNGYLYMIWRVLFYWFLFCGTISHDACNAYEKKWNNLVCGVCNEHTNEDEVSQVPLTSPDCYESRTALGACRSPASALVGLIRPSYQSNLHSGTTSFASADSPCRLAWTSQTIGGSAFALHLI